MDTSCGTPWNTSTPTFPRERSIHISRVASLSFESGTPFSRCPPSRPPPARCLSLSTHVRLSLPLSGSPFCLFSAVSRHSSSPRLPCYRVQGQPIEGNFLVPIASVLSPENDPFRISPPPLPSLSFYPSALLLFSALYFPSFSSQTLSSSVILRNRSTNSRRMPVGGKNRWKLAGDALASWLEFFGRELKLKVPLIPGEIFADR